MGFLGGVFDDGIPLGHNGGHHDVHSGANGYHIQIDMGAFQPSTLRGGIDKTALYYHLCAQGGKALDMLVNRADAEVASAGHGYLRLSEAAQ